ncbi:hypothetical protein J3R83DRAFT_11089 [Lanmaoa asiatica]|nr:hypothetical protein J3R83DRAFT_11089 [Lanmaoa asiatica]
MTIVLRNNEKNVQQQWDLLQHVQRESHVPEQRLPVAVQKEINTTVLDTAVHQGGHVDHITQKGSNVLDQSLLVPLQMDLNTIPDMTIHQGGYTVEQMRHGTMPDRQQKNEKEGKQLEEILNSSVIDSLSTSRREGEILAFFYCDFRNDRSTSSAEFIRSILSQLLRELRGSAVNPGSLIEELIKAKERGGSTLNNAKKLTEFASRAAGLSSKKPLVIVDALDECKDVQALLQTLMVLKSHVWLFATGRPLHIIMGDLSGLPFISMDDDMADKVSVDIGLHVIRELDARHRLRDLDAELKSKIPSVLCKKAGGMFRRVRCSIDTLDWCISRKEVRSTLNGLPEGLNETYERILLAIDTKSQEGQLARRALIWLVEARRPLRLNELMEALSINFSTRTLDRDSRPMHNGALLDACGNLVTYIAKTGIIILSHFSDREYLMGEFILTKLPHYHIAWGRAELQLARSCMCYISIWLKHAQGSGSCNNTVVNVSSGSHAPTQLGVPMSQTLRDYAFVNVQFHILGILPYFELVLRDIRVLEPDIEQHARIWNSMRLFIEWNFYIPSWPTSRHDLTYYILANFAHHPDVSAFLRRTALNPKEGTNPLVYAAHLRDSECARILLSRGARLNRTGCEVNGFCQVLPIEVALRNQDYKMQLKIPSSIAKMSLQSDAFAEATNDPLNKSISRPVNIFECLLAQDGANERDLIANDPLHKLVSKQTALQGRGTGHATGTRVDSRRRS